jgi:phosphohistidine phosphatase
VKRLHLLRHAKSSWEDESLPDRERPLAPRGLRASKRMARHIADAGLGIELIVCSPARRARETLDLLLGLMEPELRVEPRLYGAGVGELLELVRELPGKVDSALFVGHNPGLHEFADRLAEQSDDRLARKYPTAALASFELDVDGWAESELGRGRLVAFVRPRDLD